MDIMSIDIYNLLGISFDSTEKQIRQAYRKKCLKCHPDKCPGDSKAAEEFKRLGDCLALLFDPVARSKYDRILKSKIELAKRHSERDSKRKILIQDIERREKEAQNISTKTRDEMAHHSFMERIRKENAAILKEENERVAGILKENLEDQSPIVQVQWNPKDQAIFTAEFIRTTFCRFGCVKNIVLGSEKKKTRSALVEFEGSKSVNMSGIDLYVRACQYDINLKWLVLPKSNDLSLEDFESRVFAKLNSVQ
ncbi:dnaJ homolog subfamily C member 17-like [Octopus sinensis]|uniref:DnaJ homolog subfamily C member 17-like n=1 Tax=Octopus sinensis TaxID=2607531 RepID=A0A6P7TZQ1_9MOLL|nr:dnaJ homolog subfamily C member 17-like [Octopus sinensis]